MTIKQRYPSHAAVVWLALLVCLASQKPFALAQKKPAKPDKPEKSYGLIFGTAYGPDDHPLFGVKITIRPEGKKHPSWDLVSDHRGEFAQRVPAKPADYLIQGEAEYAPLGKDGKPQMSKKKKLRGETKVHVAGEEREDIGLHLRE